MYIYNDNNKIFKIYKIINFLFNKKYFPVVIFMSILNIKNIKNIFYKINMAFTLKKVNLKIYSLKKIIIL